MLPLILLPTVLLLQQTVNALVSQQRRDQYTLNPNAVTWHVSCNEPNPYNLHETKRHAVERAWSGALELSTSAWNRFNTLTWPIIRQPTPLNLETQQLLNRLDPGYVLLFALDTSPAGTESIRNVLRNLNTQVNVAPGINNRPPNAELQIACLDLWIDPHDGQDSCQYGVAMTESDYRSPTSTMNFCPQFFNMPRFDLLKAVHPANVVNMYQNVDYYGTDATTVVHEQTHLWWIANTNLLYEEVYGLWQCAELAWNCGQPIPNNLEVVTNADTYARYLEYGYLRERGIDGLYPLTKPNPVYLPVQNY